MSLERLWRLHSCEARVPMATDDFTSAAQHLVMQYVLDTQKNSPGNQNWLWISFLSSSWRSSPHFWCLKGLRATYCVVSKQLYIVCFARLCFAVFFPPLEQKALQEHQQLVTSKSKTNWNLTLETRLSGERNGTSQWTRTSLDVQIQPILFPVESEVRR